MATTIRFVGKDGNGVPRVWTQHEDEKTARSLCLLAIQDYVKDRPDLRDDQWLIMRDYELPDVA